MIKVSVLYPHSEAAQFDINYYCTTHMPLVARLLGSALHSYSVDQGLAGGAPGQPPVYVAMGHLLFESLVVFQTAFPPHAAEINSDIPNYTTIKPTILISEIKV